MKVFLSYQRADSSVAAHVLAYALRLDGHEAFVDTGSIGAGDIFREAIAHAVSTSNLMLALVGPDFKPTRLSEPNSVVTYEWQRAAFTESPWFPYAWTAEECRRKTSYPRSFVGSPVAMPSRYVVTHCLLISPPVLPQSTPSAQPRGERHACYGSTTTRQTTNVSANGYALTA